ALWLLGKCWSTPPAATSWGFSVPVEEAGGVVGKAESGEVWVRPPPCAPRNGAGPKGEGWGEDVP
ncbi:unnamed protein product, partial [Bubo scandiacus]